MKKALMMVAVCLMAAMAFAAQCAATTKKGMQCKREASPGSEFCWQHGGTTKAEREANGERETPKRTSRRVEREESGEQPDDAPAAKPVRRRPQREEAPTANDAPASVEGQCQATTKAGTPCKRKAVAGGKYCAQHAAKNGPAAVDTPTARPSRRKAPKAGDADEASPVAEAGLCAATTKAGTPCRRKAVAGGKYCAQHAARLGEGGDAPAAKRTRRARKSAEATDVPDVTPAPKKPRRTKKSAEAADEAGAAPAPKRARRAKKPAEATDEPGATPAPKKAKRAKKDA